VAYTSDIGESFRPIAHPWAVRAAYGVSWAYLVGDVGYEGYKAYYKNQAVKHPHLKEDQRTTDGTVSLPITAGTVAPIDDYRTVMAQRAIFQSVASMGLPAFTVHSVVRYSGQALKSNKNVMLRTWGPIGVSRFVDCKHD
jgi:mitochondrial fission process protein 1